MKCFYVHNCPEVKNFGEIPMFEKVWNIFIPMLAGEGRCAHLPRRFAECLVRIDSLKCFLQKPPEKYSHQLNLPETTSLRVIWSYLTHSNYVKEVA